MYFLIKLPASNLFDKTYLRKNINFSTEMNCGLSSLHFISKKHILPQLKQIKILSVRYRYNIAEV
jgi:hypothetical protein